MDDKDCPHGCRRPSDCLDCLAEENKRLKEELKKGFDDAFNWGYQGGTEDMEVVEELLQNLVKWGRDGTAFVWADAERYTGLTDYDLYEELTARQHFSNSMLTMRRVFKWLSIAIRIDRFHDWLERKTDEPPYLEKGDTEAYLMVMGGVTREEIERQLEEMRAAVRARMDG